MFPLGSTVFPSQVVPLHVFEPRYRQLIEDLDENGEPPTFGIALIDRGHEVGGGDHRVDVATRVVVLERRRFDDGRWAVVAAGIERLDVVEWLPDDPYPQARVRARARRDTGGGALEDVERLLRDTIELALGDEPVPDFDLSDDALTRLDQLSARAPVATIDRQRILEAETSTDQIALLREALDDRRGVLSAMLER